MEEVDEFGIPIKKPNQKKQTVDEFGIPVKKKVSTKIGTSTSTSQNQKSVSGQVDGSLDLPNPNNQFSRVIPKAKTPKTSKAVVSENFETTESPMSLNVAKLKQYNPEITKLSSEYEQAKLVPESKISEIRNEVENKFTKKGVLNNLQTGAKKFVNAIAYPTQVALSGGNEPEPLFELDEFADEKKEVQEKIKKEQALAKKQNKPIPTWSQDQIDYMVKERKIAKLVRSEKESQVRSFLESKDEAYTQDEFGRTERERMKIYDIQNTSSLNEKDKLNLKKQDVVLPALTNTTLKIKEYNEKIAKKEPLSADEIEDYKYQFANYDKLTKEAIELKKEYLNTQDKLGDSKENLDLFNREYSWGRHFKNLDATVRDIVSGGIGAVDYGIETTNYGLNKLGLPANPLSTAIQPEARRISKSIKSDADKIRSEIAKPVSVENINNWNDFGNWVADTAVSQAPIFALIATGAPGLATIGAYSTGDKYESMLEEMRPEPGKLIKNYSEEQLLAIPAIFGASEVVSATVDLYLFKNASRVYNSASRQERQLIVDGMAKRFLDASGNVLKSSSIEAVDETFTQGVQNFADIYIGGDKNKKLTDGFKDVASAGFFMGGMLNVAPMVVAKATKKFSTDNSVEKVNKEILALEFQLDNKDLTENSRNIIQEQLAKAKNKSKSLLEKRIGDMESLSNAQFNEINRLEKTQANIQNKAKEIKNDNSVNTELKKQILDNLKSEFSANEQRRINLLQRGASVQIERLPEEEQIRLKDKASRELMKEKNPDGTANITINDDEISKRAIQIYNNEIKQKNEQIQTTTTKTEPKAEVQEPTKAEKVEQLRTEEQVELKEALPNAELKSDGKIDVEKLSLTDAVTYDNIYNKYDKLITPLLENEVSDTEYSDFIDKGIVSDDRLNSIANKVKNQEKLSEKETAIFNDKTSEINTILKNETASRSNIEPNAGVRPTVEPMEQVGIEEKPTAEVVAKESVQPANDVRPIEGETKITQEPTLEDISNFLNENFKPNEANKGTKETSSKKDTDLRPEAKQSAESEQKEIEVAKKWSLSGRTPMNKRKFKGDMAKANAIEPSDVRSMVLSHFLRGAKVASSEISQQGELKAKNNGFYGIATSKGKTINEIAHDIWESQENQTLKLDTSTIKDMVEEVISMHDKVQDIADSILKDYGIESSQNQQEFEEDLQVYQEVLEEEKPSEEDLMEANLLLAQMSDAEILELVSEQEKSYEDYLKDLEERQVIFDWGPFADIKGTIQNDGNIISEDGNIYDKQFITKLEYVNKKETETPKQEAKKQVKPDATLLKEVDKKIEDARQKVRVAKDALDRKAKSLDKEMVKDQENLFGERKSSAEAKLFDERVDAQAREKATETERNNIKTAQEELKKLIQTKKDIESGKINSNQIDLEDVVKEENKQSEYKFSDSPSLKNAQAVDSSILPITPKATENILKNEGNWGKAIIGDVKNLGNGWFEVGKTVKGESILYSPTTDKAVTIVDSENKGGRNAVYVNDFINNNPTISDKQQRKDKANTEVDNDLVSKEYYEKFQKDFPNTLLAIEEKNGLITIFENGETREVEDYEFVKELKNALAKGYKGIGKVNRKVVDTETKKLRANAEVDKIAQKVKDLLPGIKDPDLKTQGFSQDQLIDLVANAVKNLINAGIEIDEAIRQVSASIKERFNIDVNFDDVKAKLEPKKETIEPEPFERKEGQKSVLTRASQGNSASVKKAIAKYSLDYEIESQEVAKANAEKFVAEVGIETAFTAVKSNQIPGAEGAFVYAEIIRQINENLESFTDEELIQYEESNMELLGEVTKMLDEKSRSAGRFISALGNIYQSSDGMYNLSIQVKNYKAQNGGTIPADILEKFTEANEKIKELEKQIAEAKKIREEQESVRSIEEIIESISRKNKIDRSKPISDKAKAKAFADKLRSFKTTSKGTLNASTPFSLAFDSAIEIIATSIEAGGKISDAIKQGVEYIRKQNLNKDEENQAIAQVFNAFEQSERAEKGIRLDDEGKLRIPHSILREKVEEGIDNVEDLVKAVKADVDELFPDEQFTERQVRDAITQYGKTTNPTKDEVEIEISIMKSLGKLLSGLEDAYSGKRPQRSGLQRRPKTIEERTAESKLRELMRDLPFDEADLRRAFKTALDAIKSRLTNELADLDQQIANGEKRKGEKKAIEYDAEANALKAERDQKRQILDELVGKPELTEEERINKAEILLEKSIVNLQEKIDAGDIAYKSKPTPLNSEKLKSLREQKKALLATMEQMRQDAGLAEMKRIQMAKNARIKRIAELKRRPKTIEERTAESKLRELMRDLPFDEADLRRAFKTALDAIKSRLTNELADLDQQIANGEKRKGEKKAIEYDAEANALKAERDQKRQILDELVGKPELTEEERINKAEILLEKSIVNLQEKIDAGDIAYKSKPTPLNSEKLKSLREQKKALLATMEQMRQDAGLAEMKRIQMAKNARIKRIAELKRRLDEKDFSKKERKPLPIDAELTRLEAEAMEWKELYDKESYKLELKNQTKAQKFGKLLLEILNIPKILSFTIDMSFIGIQGGIQFYRLMRTKPRKALEIFVNTVKAMFSAKTENRYHNELKSNPNYTLWKKAKLAITEVNYKTSAQEELFQHNIINGTLDALGDKLQEKGYTKIGDFVRNYLNFTKIFERGQTYFLNQMRINRFDEGVNILRRQGKNELDDLKEYEKVASAVNTLTGRANTGQNKLLASARSLNGTLFSSFANWLSVINQLNPYWYATLTPTARKMAISDLFHFIAGVSGFMALVMLASSEDDEPFTVETDPRSSDFMLLKKGNLRIDPWQTKKSHVVFLAKVFPYLGGVKKENGDIVEFGVDRDDKSRLELFWQYMSNKFSPGVSNLIQYGDKTELKEYSGIEFREDRFGNDYKAEKMFIPLYIQSLKEVAKEQPNTLGKTVSFLNYLGLINTQIYGEDTRGVKDRPDFDENGNKTVKSEKFSYPKTPSLPKPPSIGR